MAGAPAARALDELAHEKKVINACELQLCTMLVLKEPKGPNLQCDLTKTWARSTIKEADTPQVTWGFGDARCTVKVDVSRAEIVHAITAKEAKFRLPPQPIDCVVEQGGAVQNVRVVVSPKIHFSEGKATKLWVNLVSTDGPGAITGLIRFAIQLEDGLGLFHNALLKSINGFIHKSCPKVYAKRHEISEAPASKPKQSKQGQKNRE